MIFQMFQIKSAIVVKKVCNTEFHSTAKATTTTTTKATTTTNQDCCGPQQSAAVFRHEAQNNLSTEAGKGNNNKYNFDILSVLQVIIQMQFLPTFAKISYRLYYNAH